MAKAIQPTAQNALLPIAQILPTQAALPPVPPAQAVQPVLPAARIALTTAQPSQHNLLRQNLPIIVKTTK